MKGGARIRAGAAGLVAVATVTCVPALTSDDALVTTTRILAVRAVPAEAPPGTSVTYTPLVASPSGPASPAIAWDFCVAPLPLTEDNVVSNACLGSGSLVAAGVGPSATAATPKTGCTLFGPDTPPGTGFRPADPDPTGGYYQPLRAELTGAVTAFALARIQCNLANADAAQATAFAAAYHPNQNPSLLPLVATVGGATTSFDAIPAGATVKFIAGWAAADAETFAYFDPTSQTLTQQRESMQVAWYVTAGSLETESTGRASTDLATTTTNAWTAPSSPSRSFLFVVLRDSRGGVDFASAELTLVP